VLAWAVMEPWPALTEDTAQLNRLALGFVRAGVPVRDLQLALAGRPDASEQAQQAVAELVPVLAQLALDPALARGWLLGLLHEQALAREQRRRQGAYYTPRGIATYMLKRALALLSAVAAGEGETGSQANTARTLHLLDPAAGSGAFLLGALEVWRGQGAAAWPRLELTGLELDVTALDSARLALEAASAAGEITYQLHPCNSLLADPPIGAGGYDIVAGNPPYLDSERLTRQQPGLRDALRVRFRTARGNWDLSCVFVERALELVRPGGVIAMLVPRKLIAADYAAALHELLLEHELVEACDLAGLPVFKAGVQAAVLLARRRSEIVSSTFSTCKGMTNVGIQHVLCRTATVGPEADQHVTLELLRALPPGYFCAAFTTAAERIMHALAEHPPLSQFAEVGDGCSTAEAYKLAELVRDDAEGGGPKFVNTGLIRPYAVLWGLRELVYLKQRYRYPRLDAERLAAEFPRRWRQASMPKLVLPGLARELWAAADSAGEWACGKGAVQVLPLEDGTADNSGLPLSAWAAWFNSAPVRWLYRALFGGRGFSADSLHIGPRQLKRLPVPWAGIKACAQELAELANELSQHQQALRRDDPTRRDAQANWHESAAALRIDALVREAYAWPLDACLLTLIGSR
jgi:hypothetical protein